MKRISLLLAAGLASVTLAACGGAATSGNGTSNTPAGSAVQAHNAADVTFAQSMIPHHKQAVEMATMAATRAGSPAVKDLAAQIQAAQDPEINTMTGWLTGWGQTTAMPGMAVDAGHGMGSMPGMMSDADMTQLATLGGTAFDREFLTMMTGHHQGAVEMARTELAQGRYGPGKDLAQRIITTQTSEVARMRTLLTQV